MYFKAGSWWGSVLESTQQVYYLVLHMDNVCRYSHAMGNSNGNIDAYWTAIDGIHGLQGGFIWDWADQVLVDVIIVICILSS